MELQLKYFPRPAFYVLSLFLLLQLRLLVLDHHQLCLNKLIEKLIKKLRLI